jgi:LPXTG-motif cell wall-anchored protein
MIRRRSRAAALVAVLACLQTPAWAQEPTVEPQPPLSDDPPTPLNGDRTAEPPANDELPDTGADALLVGLAGLGLLGAGAGLRITLPRTGG